jgi:hypothetical protein
MHRFTLLLAFRWGRIAFQLMIQFWGRPGRWGRDGRLSSV